MLTRASAATRLPRMMFMGALVATLGACGGGGGDGTVDGTGDNGFFGIGDTDINLDGIVDTSFGDIDGDGDEDYDIDGDGFVDTQLDFGAYDANGDGLEDFDVNGDGLVDFSVADGNGNLAGFDSTGDGNADLNGDGGGVGPNFTEPSAQFPCGSADGDDNASENFTWSDNCHISRANQFSTSLYAAGIQRVVWCAGFQGDSNATTVDAFTDGVFGANTQQAVRDFQSARGLVSDGVVGDQTWQVMQDELVLLDTPVGTDVYGVEGTRCGTTSLFLNSTSFDNNQVVFGGWQLTEGANDDSPVPFTIDTPSGRID